LAHHLLDTCDPQFHDHTPQLKMSEKEKATAFRAFLACDKDANGSIDYGELALLLKQFRPNITGPEINRIYTRMDLDRSGDITIDEFLVGVSMLDNQQRSTMFTTAIASGSSPTRQSTSSKYEVRSTDQVKGSLGSDSYEWEIPFIEVRLGKQLGEGAFGTVYKAAWRGTPVAVKKLKPQKMQNVVLADFKKEVAILGKLRHPHVLLFLGACTHEPNMCMITEFMDGGSLFEKMHERGYRLSPKEQLKVALQSALGLNYLHLTSPPIVHRDLKTMNLLIDEYLNVKLADFGLSAIKTTKELTEMAGTPAFMAPELLMRQPYTEKVDVYSYGIMLWEIVTGQLPFMDMASIEQIAKAVVNGTRPPIPQSMHPTFAAIIQDCWKADPRARPTMEAVTDRLRTIKF